jgi:hypothetical protein
MLGVTQKPLGATDLDLFGQDAISSIVKKYLEPRVQVLVEHIEHGGVTYPVVVVWLVRQPLEIEERIDPNRDFPAQPTTLSHSCWSLLLPKDEYTYVNYPPAIRYVGNLVDNLVVSVPGCESEQGRALGSIRLLPAATRRKTLERKLRSYPVQNRRSCRPG